LSQDFQATLWIGLDPRVDGSDWIESAKMDPCPTLWRTAGSEWRTRAHADAAL